MVIICDGGKRRDVAYGSFKIYSNDGELIDYTQKIFGDNTSNSAEYLILFSAIKKLQLLGYRQHVTILTDSALVANQLTMSWNCNYEHLQRMRNQILKELQYFVSWDIKKVTRNIIVGQLGH